MGHSAEHGISKHLGSKMPGLSRKAVVSILVLALSWFYSFYGTLRNLHDRWVTEDYSYCCLVPLVFVFLVYRERSELPVIRKASPFPGFAGLTFTAVLFLVGQASALETLTYAALWLTIASLIVLFLGSSSLKSLSFPLFILLFAIPAPPFIDRTLTFNLKLLSSGIAANMLNFAGISAFREGNIIDLGTVKFQVVEACSGLRYLFPAILIALLTGYMFNLKWWQRTILALTAIPLSVGINSLRIVILAFLSLYVSASFGEEGFLHDFSGWLIFICTAVLLFLLGLALKYFSAGVDSHPNAPVEHGNTVPAADKALSGRDCATPNSGGNRQFLLYAFIAAFIFPVLHFVDDYFRSNQVDPPRRSFVDFQMQIDSWEGKREYLPKDILENLWADDYVTGLFQHPSGSQLVLLVSYYKSQTTYHTAHAPTSCLLGSGWNIRSARILPAPPSASRTFPIHQVVLEKDGHLMLSNFWFQQRGRVIASELLNKVYLFWDAISKRRTDGALVRVELLVNPNESVDAAQHKLDGFTAALKNALLPYIPD